ncbi:hypothetical protein MMC28_000909 [Mycoblastus sanguinarius]|nr:hypothetical protein [Mycoblastus sanguinarius]
MASSTSDTDFPCALTISIPLPTHCLASSALRALSVDAELSPLVRRSFSLTFSKTTFNRISPDTPISTDNDVPINGKATDSTETGAGEQEDLTVLRTEYKATTNRMLRVAVNGFMESLGVVLGVMEELDVDVLVEDE